MKKLKRMYRCIEELKCGNGKTMRCPTETLGHDRRCGFTLVEMVIVIAIVIILSVVSVPIYRNYTDKAKLTEAYALAGTILSAQKAYYAEYGNFLRHENSNGYTSYDHVLGVDARSNKYSTWFHSGSGSNEDPKIYFRTNVFFERDTEGKHILYLEFTTTSGVTYRLV